MLLLLLGGPLDGGLLNGGLLNGGLLRGGLLRGLHLLDLLPRWPCRVGRGDRGPDLGPIRCTLAPGIGRLWPDAGDRAILVQRHGSGCSCRRCRRRTRLLLRLVLGGRNQGAAGVALGSECLLVLQDVLLTLLQMLEQLRDLLLELLLLGHVRGLHLLPLSLLRELELLLLPFELLRIDLADPGLQLLHRLGVVCGYLLLLLPLLCQQLGLLLLDLRVKLPD